MLRPERTETGVRTVYQAENLIDAHLVKHLLEARGIPAFIAGEHLSGAIGELPVLGIIAIAVPESAYGEARAVIEDFDRSVRTEPVGAVGPVQPDPAAS